MADSKKSGAKRFYENRGGGFNRQSAGRPAFAQKKWDGPGRPATMHKAVCAKCGNSCEVPFRPFNNRLVYCNDCFRDQKDTENRSRNKFPQKNYNDNKKFFNPAPKINSGDGSGNELSNELKDQLRMLNTKIDRLAKAVEKMTNIEVSLPEIQTEETARISPAAKNKKAGKKVFKNYKRPF